MPPEDGLYPPIHVLQDVTPPDKLQLAQFGIEEQEMQDKAFDAREFPELQAEQVIVFPD